MEYVLVEAVESWPLLLFPGEIARRPSFPSGLANRNHSGAKLFLIQNLYVDAIQVAQARGAFWSIPVHFLSKVGAVQRLPANAADQLARLDIHLHFAGSTSKMSLPATCQGHPLLIG